MQQIYTETYYNTYKNIAENNNNNKKKYVYIFFQTTLLLIYKD